MTNKELLDFAANLMLRVKNNETVVKAYLTEAGINRFGHVRFLDLKQLYEVNNDKFMEMIQVIYPEFRSKKANGGGDDDETKPAKTAANPEAGKIAGDVFKMLFSAAGSTLSNIFGSTGDENIIRYQEEHLRQQQKTTYIILAVIAVIAIAVIGYLILMSNRNAGVQVVK